MEKKEMNELYVAPAIEVLEVQVEKGFAASLEGEGPTFTPGGGGQGGDGGF